eukprot:6178799-Amphidinium_carterae.1
MIWECVDDLQSHLRSYVPIRFEIAHEFKITLLSGLPSRFELDQTAEFRVLRTGLSSMCRAWFVDVAMASHWPHMAQHSSGRVRNGTWLGVDCGHKYLPDHSGVSCWWEQPCFGWGARRKSS